MCINILTLFISPMQSQNDIDIIVNMPAKVIAGTGFTVTLTLKKGSVSGFAKLQQQLPKGFTATPLRTEGALFSFKDQKVKFIWMDIPDQAELQVSYKISLANNLSGIMTITGTLNYLQNDQTKKFNVPPFDINIESETSIVQEEYSQDTSSNNITALENDSDTISDASSIVQEKHPQDTSSNDITALGNNSDTVSDINITTKVDTIRRDTTAISSTALRIVPAVVNTGEDFTVEVYIQKSHNAEGLATVDEELPVGFTASSLDNEGAVFTFENQQARFVWTSLPNESEIKITYRINVAADATGTKIINGTLNITELGNIKKIVIPSSNIAIAEKVLTVKIDTSKADSSAQLNIVQSINDSLTKTPSTNLTNIPAPQQGIIYRIQLAASKPEISPAFFKKMYGLDDKIYAETHQGWHKYTAGEHQTYKHARDHRNLAWGRGIKGSFVVAYNNGTRITVQEALMLTKQKWVS